MAIVDIFVNEPATTTYSGVSPGKLVKKGIDNAELLTRLNTLLANLDPAKIFAVGIKGVEVESVTINVGISVQGGLTVVALATVGVDAGISVTLRPK